MPTLKLAWALPLAQAAFAETSLQLARHAHPSIRGDIYWHPTTELFCAGLNAPADRLSLIIYPALGSWAGVAAGDLIYVALVALLWYAVGKRIDSWRSRESASQPKEPPPAMFVNALAVFYGAYLLLFLAFHNVAFTNPRNGNGGSSNFVDDILHQTLWLLWSVILIALPSISLAKAFRLRSSANRAADSSAKWRRDDPGTKARLRIFVG